MKNTENSEGIRGKDVYCSDIRKGNKIDKYEKKKTENLNNVTLAQFIAKYYKTNKVISYRDYDIPLTLMGINK